MPNEARVWSQELDATGLHLKEYTVSELADLFTAAGFSRLRIMLGTSRNMRLPVPVSAARLLERLLLLLPVGHAVRYARSMPPGFFRVIRLVGAKQ